MKNNYYRIRKKIVVIPIVSLVSNYAREVCKQNKGLEFVNISPIRGLNKLDSNLQKKIINSIISHPNISGALLVTNDHKSSQDYKNNIKSVSFLLHQDHGFDQAPYEEIDADTYKKLSLAIKKVTPTKVGNGHVLQDLECEGGACPIR